MYGDDRRHEPLLEIVYSVKILGLIKPNYIIIFLTLQWSKFFGWSLNPSIARGEQPIPVIMYWGGRDREIKSSANFSYKSSWTSHCFTADIHEKLKIQNKYINNNHPTKTSSKYYNFKVNPVYLTNILKFEDKCFTFILF